MLRLAFLRGGPARAALAALLAAFAATVADAPAQGGPGAERYEVTITPPKRPGSEAPAESAPPAPGAAAAAQAAGDPAADPAPAAKTAPPADHVLGAVEPPPSAAAAPAPPNAPLRTLQVGAFRQHASAEALREQLAPTFADVAIVEVSSGGEPLYRVNVGRLPKGAELAALKKRLADAGFPAFDVPLPRQAAKR